LACGILILACLVPLGLPTHDPSARLPAVGAAPLAGSLTRLALAVGWGWGLAALPALGALLLWVLGVSDFQGRRFRPGDERAWFFAAWAAPWLPFALLACVAAPGQLAVGLPILLLWSADALVRFMSAGSRRMATLAATLIVLGNAALFLLTPERPLLGHRAPSAATIAYHDRRLAAAIVAIRGFSPDETVILAEQWLPLRYSLPRYPVIAYRRPEDAPDGAAVISPAQRSAADDAAAMVWFEPSLDSYNSSRPATELLPMAVGELRVLRPLTIEKLVVDADSFGLQKKKPRT
jgi:hypothetical protein